MMYAKPEADGSFTVTISGELAAKPMVQAFLNAIVKEDELHLRVLETIYDQLPRIVTHIEMSSSGLNKKFKALANSAMNQANNFEKFTKLAKSIEYEGKKISMLEAFAMIDKSIGLSVEKTLFVSKMAIAMVYSLDEAMKALKEINISLGKTRLLMSP
jgi:methyl-accepting chemotaxis protein